jgi:tRNA pseudouridine32 synthase / 23S rRNA pseudouridine746 synthase
MMVVLVMRSIRRNVSGGRGFKPDVGPKPDKVDPWPASRPDPWGLKQRILYDEGGIVCLNKPAGLPLDGGRSGQESLVTWLPGLGKHMAKPPMPAHRLDHDTSGCLLLARTPGVLRRLQMGFEAHQIGKTYWAIVDGAPPKTEGAVRAPLSKRSTEARGWRMVVDGDGQPSETRYRILEQLEGRTLVELTPLTGRTHQLRVHLAHIGCPISGDVVYGRGGDKLMLHATSVRFATGDSKTVTVRAPLPDFWPPSLIITQP